MISDIIEELECPECQGTLSCPTEELFLCGNCNCSFPLINGIPRFVPNENYASSFGYQWNKYPNTLLDNYAGILLSYDRFFDVTGWKKNLKGKKILEAGCGMGRFTSIVAETMADITTFDYSSAVEANKKNNQKYKNVRFYQADIQKMPFKKKTFDHIFCLGVLQHTSNVEKSFKSLVSRLKDGGVIVIDVYDFSFRTIFNLKYWFRPITRQMNHEKLLQIVKKVVPILFPIKMWITEKIPILGKYLAFFIPISYHKGFILWCDNLPYNQLLEWSIVDTFDKYSPTYDKPQTKRTVKRWFRDAGLKDFTVEYGPNGIIARGQKGTK